MMRVLSIMDGYLRAVWRASGLRGVVIVVGLALLVVVVVAVLLRWLGVDVAALVMGWLAVDS